MKFEGKYGFVYKEKHLPTASQPWKSSEATKEVPNSVTRSTCIPSMLLGKHNSGGSVWSGPDENPTTGQPYNHDSSETNVTYTKARLTMKKQATNTRDKPSQIFAQVVANCKDDVQTIMPLEENWKRTMRYHRPTPPVPHSLADMTITEIYSVSAEKIINDGFSYSENV